MRFEFRAEALADLVWFRTYYTSTFPAGAQNARLNYKRAMAALQGHPLIGHLVSPDAPIREFVIPRIPFSFIYFVQGDRIIITRVLDNRAERPEELRL